MMMMLDVCRPTTPPADSALRPVGVVDSRHSLVGVHDVIQCSD